MTRQIVKPFVYAWAEQSGGSHSVNGGQLLLRHGTRQVACDLIPIVAKLLKALVAEPCNCIEVGDVIAKSSVGVCAEVSENHVEDLVPLLLSAYLNETPLNV